jgi:hypothetical protein
LSPGADTFAGSRVGAEIARARLEEATMSSTAKRVGLGIVAAASIAGIAFVAVPVRADKKLTCEMTGTWIEQNDRFVFQAAYIAKDGPDTFKGLYFNASAGTTANVTGAAEKGTWLIKLDYTDKMHRGQTRELVGTGRLVGYDTLTVNGSYVYKELGRQIGVGTFSLIGKCK